MISELELTGGSVPARARTVEMGTPPQPQYVQIDTGSFELWVNADCSSLNSTGDKAFCEGIGRYDPGASSTSAKARGAKTLMYGIGRASIQYYTDDISLYGTSQFFFFSFFFIKSLFLTSFYYPFDISSFFSLLIS